MVTAARQNGVTAGAGHHGHRCRGIRRSPPVIFACSPRWGPAAALVAGLRRAWGVE
jgi:hypothetical protein